MGRASRTKRERRAFSESSLGRASDFHAIELSVREVNHISLPKVYRFFKDASQADALVSGKVWLSTLEVCRAYEDPLQGDPNEAIHEYNSGHAVGGSGDAAFELIAARTGIHIGPGCSDITVSNCTSVQKLPDAFVLCTTESFNPDTLGDTFGRYCVEISNPSEFFRLLTMELSKIYQVREAAFGRVIYRERSFVGLQDPPGPVGFVMPPDRYKDQREVRFLWVSNSNARLQPFLLNVPNCAALCKRIG